MKYDFDRILDRKASKAVKWDVADGELPMWVADMDFETAPEIKEAILKRAEMGDFGYSDVDDEWRNAYIDWWRNRHGFTMKPEWLLFSTGVVPSISAMIRRLTAPAGRVVLLSPNYNCFYRIINWNGRIPSESPMIYENGEYRIDFEDLEKKLADPDADLMIFCNPQNPTGQQWSAEEMARIAALCERHGVTVISDEIHCDLADPGTSYVPFLSVNDQCRRVGIMTCAPTKAFNLAGMHTSAVCAADENLRNKAANAIFVSEIFGPGTFSVPAAVAAFKEGGPWLDELCAYIKENKDMMRKAVAEEMPKLHIVPSAGTYLLWMDVSGTGMDGSTYADELRKETGLYFAKGEIYGTGGKNFVRINLACPHAYTKDAIGRMKKFYEAHC